MSPYSHPAQMENPIQSLSASPQLSGQGYGSQLSSPAWTGSPIRQSSASPSMDTYPQAVTRYYQGSYMGQQNSPDIAQYMNSNPSNHHSAPSAYNSQYAASRQSHYPSGGSMQPSYAGTALKANYGAPYYAGNVVQQGSYPTDGMNMRQSNYASSPFYPAKKVQCVSPVVQQQPPQQQQQQQQQQTTHSGMAQNIATSAPQQTAYAKQSMQYPKYVNSYPPYVNDSQSGYGAKQYSTAVPAVSQVSSTPLPAITSAQTNGQLSSIPTPPETTSAGDLPGSDGPMIADGVLDCGKMTQVCSSSYGTSVTYSSNAFPTSNSSMVTATSNGLDSSRAQNWNSGGQSLQPSPNIDEGSQASSASASSSIPDEQNSAKASSKPNFSYPPTPNTLSSPGAASMSSFHDDLECISSPGWPRTPASPVAPTNNNYEFANVKRPESLLKLYGLSDEPERRYFLDKLLVFNEDRGSPITQCPTISKQPLDVFRVYLAVKERGGFVEVTNAKRWKDVAGAIGVGASSSAAYTLRKQYMKLLLPFECKYDRGGIDPQPIINQVEASSRKKNKNSTSGTQNMCLPGYHQSMDGYQSSSYADCYPPSRYPCNPNNIDYRYAQNSAHYQQPMQQQHHPSNNSTVTNQQQYSQYQRSCQTPYGYYPGNNASNGSSHGGSSMPVGYSGSGTHQSNMNSGMCRYSVNNSSSSSSASSTPAAASSVPDSGYCATNYASEQNYPAQSGNTYKYNYNEQGIMSSPVMPQPNRPPVNQGQAGQTVPYSGYAGPSASSSSNAVSNSKSSASPMQQDPSLTPCKPLSESVLEDSGNDSSLSSGNSSSLDNMSYEQQNFAQAKQAFQEQQQQQQQQLAASPAPCPTPKPVPPQPFRSATPVESKSSESDCSGSVIANTPSSVPAPVQPPSVPPAAFSNCNSSSSTSTSSTANFNSGYTQPAGYPNSCQQKAQNLPSNYGQYANASNENYRGSEGPPLPASYPPPPPSRMVPQQGKFSGPPKEPINSFAPTYPMNSQHPKQPMYGNYPNYGHMQSPSKDQYHSNYYKPAVYNNTPGRPKSWNSSSCYPYQNERPVVAPPPSSAAAAAASAASSGMEINVPEIKKHPEAPMPRVPKPAPSSVEAPRAETKVNAQRATSPHVHYLQSRKGPPPAAVTSTAPPHCFVPTPKKPIEFPPGTVEAVRPNYRKKRRYSAKRVSPLDPWKLMLSLKSGLLTESTWALNALSVLLCDNSSAVYFRLSHLPGLLSVLVEHYRRFLNIIFGLFEDFEIGSEKKKKCSENVSKNCESGFSSLCSCQGRKRTSSFNWNDESRVLNSTNFTFKTRCNKAVNIQYDEALFLIDPEQKWDAYEGFNVSADDWQTGFCDITDHIATPFESVSGNKITFFRDMDAEKPKKGNSSVEDIPVTVKSLPDYLKNCKSKQLLLPCKGEPIVVLKKCNFLQKGLLKDTKQEDNLHSDAENSRTSVENDSDVSNDKVVKQSDDNSKKGRSKSEPTHQLDFAGLDMRPVTSNGEAGSSLPTLSLNVIKSEVVENDQKNVEVKIERDADRNSECSEAERCADTQAKNCDENPEEITYPRLRLTSLKRGRAEELEDEAYTCDKPSLNLLTEQQEALVRRCMCISNILRNLSFIPGNDIELNKNSSLLLVLGKLLLLHHKHKPVKPAHRKYDKDVDVSETDDSCISLREDFEWWYSLLHVLRDNTLVVLSNIAGQLDLSPFPEEISLPILDGLLHWVVCPSSYARDPLPVKPSLSVLTPQRLSLEILSKLSVLDNNIDLMIATPPWSRIEKLFEFLIRALSPVEDKVLREFSIVLLSSFSQADTCVARAIANQSQCISYLIAFIEQAEASAFQVATTQGTKKLRDNPEIIGTTPNMVARAARILRNLASVQENQTAFFQYQQRLLTLATSQIIEQELASVIADVLFYCSAGDESNDAPFLFLAS